MNLCLIIGKIISEIKFDFIMKGKSIEKLDFSYFF